MKTRDNKKWNAPIAVFIIFLVFILVLFLQYCHLSLFPNIYGINMEEFSLNRNTYETILDSKRGTIYDSEGNILATDISSYTVIAYLDESRTGSSKTLYHVADVEKTAEALSPILNMTVEKLSELMSIDAYQVELGPGGRGITELTKKQIEDLELPGISFIESYKRYYPNGDFASYIVGYAKRKDVEVEVNGEKTEKSIIAGELGIEMEYEDILKGINGSLSYQRDKFGYKIPDTPEENNPAVDGSDIYLTLDANIQRIVESYVNVAEEKYEPEWMVMNIMDAKTGDILASSSTPSFDPNILNITNYENPLTSFVYEPGSVMKTFTYMCAMEKGTYQGDAIYPSGSIVIGDDTVYDWNKVGWGNISYDLGYQLSSNVGISYLVQDYINKDDLKSCLNKYGFGAETGINLPRELTGTVSFNYPIEVASAGFGQGISITPVQMLRALTMISNEGKMLKPNIISKIVDSNGEITYERKIEESEQVISQETVKKIRELMYNTVNDTENATGRGYKVDGLDVIGKTGTAQIYDSSTGSYTMSGGGNKIFSFTGMFPKDDPQIIIFTSIKKPNNGTSASLINTTQPVLESIGKYLGLLHTNANDDVINKYVVDSFISKDTEEVSNMLEEKGLETIILGDGNKIIDQYPKKGYTLLNDDKIFLLTNNNILMPDLIDYSRIDAIALLELLNVNYELEGYGSVSEQSIDVGEAIDDTIILKLEKEEYIEKENIEKSSIEEKEE